MASYNYNSKYVNTRSRPGDYNRTYRRSAGNEVNATRVVRVRDTKTPTIQSKEAIQQLIEAGTLTQRRSNSSRYH